MRLIALEEHVLPADLVDQVWPTPMGAEALTRNWRTSTSSDCGSWTMRASTCRSCR